MMRQPGAGLVAEWVALVLLLALTSGCASMEYVTQAGCGQLGLMVRARGIDDVIGDPHTPAGVRRLLGEIAPIKRFGERHGLSPTNNYTTYVDVGAPAVVWLVTASEPLRFHMKTWSFPVVGSVPYLGWFRRSDARMEARDLSSEGWDVDVRGASAFSTLGWFKDPVLSTMIEGGDEALGELSNVTLHESLHATLYIEGQSALNESIASFVGDRLAVAYLEARTGAGSREVKAYQASEIESAERTRSFHEAFGVLEALYASKVPDAEKLAKKAEIIAELRERLGIARPITNATLAQFQVYNSADAELEGLLASCGGSFPRLIRTLGRLRDRDLGADQRSVAKLLAPIVREGCVK